MRSDKHFHGRWSAGLARFPSPEGEVILGAVFAEDEEAPELRSMGRWLPGRGMIPDLGALMDRAIREPVEGRPHLPAIVRVARAEDGEDIQRVRPETRVEIGPTPFLVEELERLHRELGSKEAWRWLTGDVTPSDVDALFSAGRAFAAEPWYLRDPAQVWRVDLGGRQCAALVECQPSVTGVDVMSVAIAPTRAVFEAWLDDVAPDGQIDVWFYERDDLPAEAWAEAEQHRFVATEDELYPRVVTGGAQERDSRRDEVLLAIDVIDALARFTGGRHDVPEAFGAPSSATLVLASGATATVSVDPDDLVELGGDDEDDDEEVDIDALEAESMEDEAFLALDDADPWPEAPPPAPATVRNAPKPGRNDACWCGSGKKYKKCHLDADEAKAR